MSIREHKGKKNLHKTFCFQHLLSGISGRLKNNWIQRMDTPIMEGSTNKWIMDGYSFSIFSPSEGKQPYTIMPYRRNHLIINSFHLIINSSHHHLISSSSHHHLISSHHQLIGCVKAEHFAG
ncbi:MAG: hypothetical protein ACRC6F_10945 [Aeromonas sp.]